MYLSRFGISLPAMFLVCVLMVLTAATSMAGDSVGELAGDQKMVLDAFIGQFVDLAMFDGTVLIDIGGKIVYNRSFGLAQYELGVPHGENTCFRIASVSKSLTDTAFAKMIEQQKLSLDDPLARYLPDYPSAGKITLGHILSHTSGIPHTNAQPWGDGSISLTISEIVDRLAQLPLDFEPGTESKYSNGGYAVAARVLEIVGEASFPEVMRSTVFGPLGLKDTGHIADARKPINGMATGYEPGRYPGERRHPRFYAVETRPGGGSLYSSAQDLLRFTRAIFREDFVSAELRRDVLGADEDGFLSQGRSPGFVAKVYYAAEDDLIVVSVANSYAVPADWAKKIAAIATGSTDIADWPEIHPANPTVAAGDSRLGRYRSSRGGTETTIERTERGAMEISGSHGQGSTALIPLSDGAFLMPLYFQRCEQAEETRVISCGILSGDKRYSTTLTPILLRDAVSE